MLIRRVEAVLTAILMLVMPVLLTGCGAETKSNHVVYYMNNSGNKLVEKYVDIDENLSQYDMANEFIRLMNEVQKQDDYNVIKPDNVEITDCSIQNSVINIYFSKEYNDMGNARKILLRAAIVKTLTQIPDIQYIKFYVDGKDATYEDGTVIGIMGVDDFVDDSNEMFESVEWKTIDLYYANKLGDKLVEKREQIAYSKNVSLEKIVLEKLINGADNTENFSTVPKDLKVLGVSTSNGVCYVNLSSVFLTEMVNVSGEVSLYSIVNTLCRLENVNSVKILVNGNSAKTFRENINLDQEFNFNLYIIESAQK